MEGGAGRVRGGDRGEDSQAIQTSGAWSAARSRHCDRGCTGKGCREQARVSAAMVKISFQPAVAGVKAEKADKAAASGPASASAPAAEILLTPARVRGTGSQWEAGRGGAGVVEGPRLSPVAAETSGTLESRAEAG